MGQENAEDESLGLTIWEPMRLLRKLSPTEVRLSRGFLRARVEKWFPAFATNWLPLAHSLGVELRVTEVRPVLEVPHGFEVAFGGTLDGEPVGVFCDLNSKAVLLAAMLPSVLPAAGDVTMEYLARRFLATLAMAWSGPESSVVLFDSDLNPFETEYVGGVKLSGTANGNQFMIWVGLGRLVVDRLDGLWRRQVQSTSRPASDGSNLHVEVGQLAVPPTMLSDYLRAGTVIDLEVPVGDQATLRLGSKAWLSGKLVEVSGQFGVEVQPALYSSPSLPEGTTRLSIEIGHQNLDPGSISELSQAGAIWATGIPVTDKVQLLINGEVVGAATLGCYQGRFAITVS